MLSTTDDLRIKEIKELTTPEEVMREIPRTLTATRVVMAARNAIHAILNGTDDRLLVIVGPCSIHDPSAAIDYAERLVHLRERLSDRLEIVMRVYFEKPRTTVGWKGLINDPGLDGSFNINKGLRLARSVLSAVNNLGLPAGAEFLDMTTPQYIADLVSWAAIGARTTESQTHREMASGLSMPVGFKNSTDGNLQVAVNAIESARHPHSFLGINQEGLTAIVRTTGNPDTHVVLRGGKSPNYDARSIEECCRLLKTAGLEPRVLVDCSHAQTAKEYTRQPSVLTALVEQRCDQGDAIMGVMLESNIGAGNQPLGHNRGALKYGVSITDPCIDWPTTEQCLSEAAESLAISAAR